MEDFTTYTNDSYLNGIQSNSEIPPYFITDSSKILKVNFNATGLEWSNETQQDGFKASVGDGISNTSTNYNGFVFNTNETTGLFNYGLSNQSLGLRINTLPIIECESNKILLNKNIQLQNDNLLTSASICFGINEQCFITGDSTTNNQNKISFSTDNQERLRISTDNNILCKARIQIDNNLLVSLSQPQIYNNGMFLMGINLDSTNGSINFSSSSLNSICELKYDKIDLKEPVIFRNPTCYPDLRIIIDGSYTVPAGLTGNPIYYMKRGLITHSDITFPNPASSFNPRYEIITDSQGNSSTFNCRLTTVSNDVLRIENGARTLQVGPVLNFVLVLNAHYIITFCDADNRWIMIRTT